MTSNQIVEAVENYVRDENAKYALLIDSVKVQIMLKRK